MAEKLKFDLVSPERLLLSEMVDLVVVPGVEGEFGVMSQHAPIVSVMRPGIVQVQIEGQADQHIFVRGGFAEVTPAGLTILAEFAVPVEQLDGETIEREIKNAEEDVADAITEDKRQAAQEKLDHLREMQQAL
ncbi:MAG: F0F1 ATP synthase subunit epsilon [Rhizobiales bacterium]|nr:F0F1 ATP synthase subunit epsilon [Hyphomicrobiales bacterium]